MVRLTVRLTPAQASRLRRLAAEREVSMSEIIRQSVDAFSGSSANVDERELRRRAFAAAGALRGGPPDLAREHDRYLGEALERGAKQWGT